MVLDAISSFIRFNVRMSRALDRRFTYPPAKLNCKGDVQPKGLFSKATNIADVGGGKKPYAIVANLSLDGKTYAGLDLDADELSRAPQGTYTEVHAVDICQVPMLLQGKFDLVVCRSTLEHVRNTARALEGISALLVQGGLCYVRLPCRKAMFARINKMIPNEIKRKAMHFVFPHKQGDGFVAFYDQCSPKEIRKLAENVGLLMIAERRSFRSTYFSFLFPLYTIWRLLSTLQYIVEPDYCESFEMVFSKVGSR